MPEAMAGLSVLLETTTTTTAAKQQLQCATPRAPPPQIIRKSTILNARTAMSATPSSPASSSMAALPAQVTMTTSSFLHRCFLCRRELADGVDIYIYRGDRAFCSEECRCRHILIEEDDDGAMDCAGIAAAGRSRRRRQAAAGEFAF